MKPLQALAVACSELAARLAHLTPDSMTLPSICPGWTVFDLVNHVNGGGHRYLLLLQGADAKEVDATRYEDHVGLDPTESFWRWQEPLGQAFASEAALERVVHHPLGDRSGKDLLGMRLLDLTLHAWDLARSLAREEHLDPLLVDHLLTHQMHIVEELRSVGVYGSEGTESFQEGQAELLRRTGRLALQ